MRAELPSAGPVSTGLVHAFEGVLREGIASGEFPARLEPEPAATFLLSVLLGLRSLSRGHADEARLRAVVVNAIAALNCQAGPARA